MRALVAVPEEQILYALQNVDSGVLHAYTVDTAGQLTACSPSTRLPATAAYVALDRTRTFLLGASYHENLIMSRGLQPSGGGVVRQHVIGGVGRAHAILPSPNNKFLYYTSLAQDQVFWCRFDAATGALTDPVAVDLEPGAGPRHLRLSPNGEHLYVLNELRGTVTAFDRDEHSGSLAVKQTIESVPSEQNMSPGWARSPITPDPPSDSIWCAEIRLSPDGQFLYTTERASSSLSIFQRDQQSGNLTYIETVKTEQQPRGMNIDPTGSYLAVAGELSNHITVFKIHPTHGSLLPVGRYPCSAGPLWLEFLESPERTLHESH